jgi:hypothetical protein
MTHPSMQNFVPFKPLHKWNCATKKKHMSTVGLLGCDVCDVDLWVYTNILEKHTASIFNHGITN